VKNLDSLGYYGALYISPLSLNEPILYSKKQPGIGLLDHISGALEKEIEKSKLLDYNIQNLDSILKQIRTNVNPVTKIVDQEGKSTNEPGCCNGPRIYRRISDVYAGIHVRSPGDERGH